MTDFLHLKKVIFSLDQLEFIYKHLREAGAHGVEAVGLFYGVQQEEIFEITDTLIPEQKSYRTEHGLLYMVPGEELYRLNVWAYEKSVRLIAQVHSHPQEAFHSETDDDYPIMTTTGGYSIVIPDFAEGPIDFKFWEVYQLMPEKGWTHISEKEIWERFKIK
jgi:Prokaryotic homologs of the JAB domain